MVEKRYMTQSVNLLLTTKSQELPWVMHMQKACYISLKIFW